MGATYIERLQAGDSAEITIAGAVVAASGNVTTLLLPEGVEIDIPASRGVVRAVKSAPRS